MTTTPKSDNAAVGGSSQVACPESLSATMKNLLHYEICAAWWPQFTSWGPLQNIIAAHFARKIERKYRRWMWCLDRQKRMKPNDTQSPGSLIPTVRRGWRHFHCADCEHRWKWPSRDALSPSGENCPRCDEWCHPYNSEIDDKIPCDDMGNLTVPWTGRVKLKEVEETRDEVLYDTTCSVSYLEGALAKAKTWSIHNSSYPHHTEEHKEWLRGYADYPLKFS